MSEKVLSKEQVNDVRSRDQNWQMDVVDLCDSHEALRAERDALKVEHDRFCEATQQSVVDCQCALRAERDAALAEVDSLRTKHDAKVDRINALEAEVERMRPVVEAAVRWAQCPGWAEDPLETFDASAGLRVRVDAFRASAQKEARP